jgi:tripartite-type tricarboxylate transporter receptor subunit TctC
MLAGIPLYLLPLLSQGSATFDARKDFTPITRVARVALGVVVSSDSPYKTLEELIQALKDQPGDLTYSSQGIGSAAHLCSSLFIHMTGTKAQHIPYKSTTTATTDVAAGRISFAIQSPPAILGLIEAGKLRLLAVTGEQRWPDFPDVRTVQEAGVADFEASSWLDFIAPKGTPQPVVELLNREIVSIAEAPEYAEFCKKQSFAPDIVDYRQVAAEMDAEAAKWKQIVDVALAG